MMYGYYYFRLTVEQKQQGNYSYPSTLKITLLG